MMLFNNLSLRSKITSIIIVTASLALVVGFSIALYSEYSYTKNYLIAEKTLTAKIVGNYTAPDLIFNNKKTAIDSISYLKSDDSIENAYLYDERKEIFVELYPEKNLTPPDLIEWSGAYMFDEEYLHVLEPISMDDQVIGYLKLSIKTDRHFLNIYINSIYLMVLLLFLVFVTTVFARRMSGYVTKPINELTNSVRSMTVRGERKPVSTKNYDDETGKLTAAFEDMLDTISKRELERDIANTKLQQNKDTLKSILDNLVDGVISIDDNNNIITFNNSAQNMLGYTEKEVIGRPLSSVINLPMTSDGSSFNIDMLKPFSESCATTSTGDSIPVQISHVKLPRETSNNIRYVLSFHDMSMQKQQEEQLRRTQKMDALGKLTGGIAHDFNNMLGIVSGYSELLHETLKDNPKLQRYVNEIMHAGERGAKLTRKLLSFSKHKAAESHRVNINSIIKDEQHMLEKTLTARINLILDLDDSLCSTDLDPGDLEDASLNLCINAMHAINDTGTITIQTRNFTLSEPESAHYNLQPGEYVTLSFIDTGCGMDKVMIENIFDPFFSTKGDKGTGLGLSQVYGFVERSNGKIEVYSEPGHGSRFTLYFPISKDEQDKRSDKSDLDQHLMHGDETILVVDDEVQLLMLSCHILESYGYKTFSAKDANEALDILKNNKIDLMISDVIMPEIDGYKLASIVQKEYPSVKIQLASGFTDDRHVSEENKILHQTLLHKPFNKQALMERVRQLLDQ